MIEAENAPTTQKSGPGIFKTKDFAIALPANWKNDSEILSSAHPLVSIGNGIGVPLLDDTESPLQIGIKVDHITVSKKTLLECIQIQRNAIFNADNHDSLGEPKILASKLADGRDAVVVIFEFVKDKSRRNTQIKLITMGDKNDQWIVSAWAIGGKDSRFVESDNRLVKWLIGHLATFTLNSAYSDMAKIPLPLFFEIAER